MRLTPILLTGPLRYISQRGPLPCRGGGVISNAYSVTHALTPSLHGGYHIRKEFSILLLPVNENSMTRGTILDLFIARLSPL